MVSIQRFFPDVTSTVFGGAFIALGVYLLTATDHLTPGLGAVFIGIFTMMVMTGKTVDEEVSMAGMKGDADTLDELLEELGIEGAMIQIPSGDLLSAPRTFVPVEDFQGLPDLQDEMVIVTSGGGRAGISLIPPGLHLMELAESSLETPTEGLEGAREVMGVLTHGLGLAKSFSLREDEKITVRITHGTYGGMCRELREKRENICTRTGCPLCSAYLTAGTQYLKRPLRLVDFKIDGEHVIFEMEEIVR